MAKGAHGGKRAGKTGGASQNYTMQNGVKIYDSYSSFLTGELGYDSSKRETTDTYLSVSFNKGVDIRGKNITYNGKVVDTGVASHKITKGTDAVNTYANRFGVNKIEVHDNASGKLLERHLSQLKSGGWSVTAQSGNYYILERKH